MALACTSLLRLLLVSLVATEATANGISIPLRQVDRPLHLRRRDAALSNVPNQAYSASGSVRNQTFEFLIDTGSADVFVPDPSCPTDQCGDGQPYDRDGKDLNENVTLAFGAGNAQGELFVDSLTLDGLTATNQTIVSASSNSITNGTNITGLIGFGFEQIAKTNATPFFLNLVNEKVVQTPEFSVYLELAVDGGSNQGELTLGGRNEDLFEGPTTAVPVSTKGGLWTVAVDGVNVNGKSVGSAAGGASGFIDTGGPILVGPIAAIAAMFAAIPGALKLQTPDGEGNAAFFAIPCDTSAQNMPALVMSGQAFDIAPIDLIGVPATNVGKSGYCVANAAGFDLGSAGFGSGGWQLGDVFLRNWYTIFSINLNNNTASVEFARAKRHATKPIQQSPQIVAALAGQPATGPAGNGSSVSTGAAIPLRWSMSSVVAAGLTALWMLF